MPDVAEDEAVVAEPPAYERSADEPSADERAADGRLADERAAYERSADGRPADERSGNERAAYERPAYERSVRATALGRGTHGVPEVRRLVEDAFSTAFPRRLWVAGQVARTSRDDAGALRFGLRSSGDGESFQLACQVPAETVPPLVEVLDRVHDAELDDVVLEGRLARVGGLLRFDVPAGGPVLFVSALDPSPAERGLAEERAEGLAAARARGLAEHQRRRVCRAAPLRVALVGGADDPALLRVRERLATSGFGLQLHAAVVPLRDVAAPAVLAGAVREAALRSDVVLVVREQGRPLGLGVFDRPEVAQAVADAPVPVVTALGGGGETTVSDEVAYASLPTADDAAAWLLTRLDEAERTLRELRDQVGEEVRGAAARARTALDVERGAVAAAGEQAEQRAALAHRRRWALALAGAALLAVALVVVAVWAGRPLLLTGLLLLAAALAAAWLWSTRRPTRGIRGMNAQDDEFDGVLAHLRDVRDQLARTSSPETVRRLRELAAQLVGRGEAILGRELDGSGPERSMTVEPAPTLPTATQAPLAVTPLEAASPARSGGSVRLPRSDDPDVTQVLPTAGRGAPD